MGHAVFFRPARSIQKGICLALCIFLVMPNFAMAGQIIADGQTETVVAVQGDTTDISTSTFLGQNAFNSFSRFNVDSGETVNLHVPSSASSLLNLVHGDVSTINGVLNSFKDGSIGGNVFFLNPDGFVVGTEGVINVGSLSVVTPTKNFTDNFFTAPGAPAPEAVSAILDGTVPISETGLISVKGKIRAIADIRLSGQNVVNSGSIQAGTMVVADSIDFSDIVNIDGLESGNVEIEASNEFTNQGTIAADGFSNQDAGTIKITAGNDVTLAEGSTISARGAGENSKGGTVDIYANRNAQFNTGALIDVRGGEVSGDGGFIELSGHDRVILNGGIFKAAANSGQAGSILVDPNDIEVLSADQLTDGAAFSLVANNSITVGDGVTISTRNIGDVVAGDHLTDVSEGNSGQLILQAPQITVGNGSMLLAHVNNDAGTTYQGGNLLLLAAQNNQSTISEAAAAANITIGAATLKAENISLAATSYAEYEWSGTSNLVMRDMSAKLGSTMANVKVAVAQATADSSVIIGSGAHVEAAGNVDLVADSNVSATTKTKHQSTEEELGVGFVYGEIDSTATVDVQDGATIKSADLLIAAKNTSTLNIKVQAISKSGDSEEAAIAVTSANIDSLAQIASGATIETGNDLSISAVNLNSFSTKATAKAAQEGNAGIAASIFTANTNAQAINNANLSGLNNLEITSYDNTTKNITNASAVAGGGGKSKTVNSAGQSGNNYVAQKTGSSSPGLNQASGVTKGPKLAGAVSIVNVTQDSTAAIGGSAQVDAAEDVVVVAQTRDAGMQNKAESTVKSKATTDVATYALSAAVAYSDYEHNAEAYLGDNSQVTAQRVGVRSDVLIPYGEKWSKLDEVDNIIEDISLITDAIGSPLLTGFANATGAAEDLSIAGSVNYMDITNNSSAYLGQGAHVTLLPSTDTAWETTLPNNNLLSWQAPLAVTANTDVTGVFSAGNINFTLSGAGGDPGAASAGGAYNQVNYNNTTKGYISGGATVDHTGTEAKDVSVTASTKETAIAIGPTSGRGGSYGLSGMFSLVDVDSTTEAFVSDKANVTGHNLLINAAEDVIAWSLTGAFNKSESAGVGAVVAMNDITTNTRAYVGSPVDGSEDELTLAQGTVNAESVDIKALTDGRIESISVAAAIAGSNPEKTDPAKMSQANDKLTSATDKANTTVSSQSGSSDPATKPKFGLAVSGSASINFSRLTTEAFIDQGKLTLSGSKSGLAVQALNNTDISAASGSAALAKAKKDSSNFSAAIAGSVAFNDLSNTTSAGISNSQVAGAQEVRVQALAGGQQLAVAIGLAVNSSANQDKAASAAGSVSLNFISNDVTSEVEDSTLVGAGSGSSRILDVTAYDRSKVGTGGGSLTYGGKAGIGAAFSYTEMSNTIGSYLSGSTISNYDILRVNGFSAAKIGAGAGMAGFATSKTSNTLGGAVVVSTITNEVTAQIRENSTVNVTGDVSVLARDTKGVTELDELINQAVEGQIEDELDYSGSQFDDSPSEDGSSIISVAGIAQASGNNVGISFTWNEINNTISARVSDSGIYTNGDLTVNAYSGAKILGLSVGAGLSTGKFAGAASVTVNEIGAGTGNNVTAEISNSTIETEDVTVKAEDKSKIDSLAGQVTASIGKVSAGGAIAHNQIGNQVSSKVQQGSSITSTGATLVEASNDSTIRTLSAAGGGSAGLAFNASASSAHISNTTSAEFLGSTVNSAGAVSLLADDDSEIDSLAGAVSVASKAAVGAAVAVNTIGNTTEALFDGATLEQGSSLTTQGTNTSTIRTLAAAVGGASSAAVTGSVGVSNISNTTTAEVLNSQLKDTTSLVTVLAEDDSEIRSITGSAAVSGTASFGIATSTNRINNTTTAKLSGGTATVDNLLIKSLSDTTIRSIAVGVGGAGTVGVGGSVAVNLIDSDTASSIESGAKITAQDNVGVVAETHDQLSNAAGTAGVGIAAAGVGASVSVNHISGDTTAYISGADTVVTAQALDSTNKLSVAKGGLTEDVNLTDSLNLGYNRPDLKTLQQTEEVTGLAVNASGTHSIENTVANVGVGTYAGVAGTTSVNTIDGDTKAYLDGAKATSDTVLSVKASDHAYGHSFIGSLGVGAAGIGVGVDTTIFANDTRAYVTGANPVQAGAMVIDAHSSQGASSLTASGSGGVVGVVGTGTVGIFRGTTEAYLQSTPVTVGSLAVNADHTGRLYVKAGGATAGAVAVAGTFTVGIDESTTQAYVADTTVTATGDVDISADNTSEINNWSVSGAAAGAAGVAGSVLVSLTGNTTLAYLTNSHIGVAGARANSLSVTANDEVISENTAGAVGLSGGYGVGATAAVVKVDNTTSAYVEDSSVFADNDALIEALAVRDIATVAVSGGIGLGVGIGGTAAVTLIGSELTGDAAGELNKGGTGTLSKVDDLTQGDRLTDGTNIESDDNTGLTEEELARLNASSKAGVTERLNPDVVRSQTTALVIDSNLTTGGDARISAAEKISAVINAGAAAGGIGAGIGGSVGVMDVTTNLTAATQGSTSLKTEQGKIQLLASAGELDGSGVSVNTYQGSAGLVSLGAAVSSANVTNNVTAQAQTGTTVEISDTTATKDEEKMTVKAEDAMDVSSTAYGASGGGVAAGVASATAIKDGTTRALFDGTSGLTSPEVNLSSGLFQVHSGRTGSVRSYSLASDGGVISGSGSAALAKEEGKVEAKTGDFLTIDGSESYSAVKVEAVSVPQISAEAKGIGVGGARVGVSVATARAGAEILASLGSDNTITAKALTVGATLGSNGSAPSVQSLAKASGGGLLLGVNATSSTAENATTVTSSVASGTNLVVGTTTVSAQADTKQRAESSAATGGIVAAGGNYAKASSNTITSALLADEVQVSGEKLDVQADGTDDNFAQSTSGSGGVVSGSAAISETKTTGSTTASVGSGSLKNIWAADFDLTADHVSRFNAQTNSVNAAVVGASGSKAINTVNYSVTADVSQDAVINSTDINIGATNSIIKNWLSGYNVTSGSGGAVDAAAASSTTDIANYVNINIGDNALLNVYGDRKNPGHLVISGQNNVTARDRVKLNSGGAISVALAKSRVTNNHNDASISIGTGAQLDSVGDVDISLRTNTDIRTATNVKTYGGSGAAEGEAESSADINNSINVGSDVSMWAAGDINLRVGNNRADEFSSYTILADTDLWNKTVLPIETKPEADAYLDQSNTIALGAGSDLRSVGHIRLLTEDGTQNVRGYGVGKDLYRQALEEIGQFFSDLVGGGDVSLEIKGGSSTNRASSGVRVDGTVRVGIENQRYLTIDEDGNIDEEHTSDGITIVTSEEDLVNDIAQRLAEVEKLLAVMPAGGSSSAGADEVQEAADLTAERSTKSDQYDTLTTQNATLAGEIDTKSAQITANESRIAQIDIALQDTSLTDEEKVVLTGEKTYLINRNATLDQEISNNVTQIVSNDVARESLTDRIIEINTRLEELSVILANSDSDGTSIADLRERYEAEKVMLLAQLGALEQETAQVIKTTDDITAKSSNIYVKGDALTGQGNLLAPGDTKIHVINYSPNFLRINHALTIPDEAGGHIYLNDVSVANNAEINLRNFGSGAQFGQILTADNTTPEIIVKNSYIPVGTERAPDLFVDATVRNRNGLIQLTSAHGSVQIAQGVDVLGKTIKVSAGRDIFVGYKTGFRHVGGDIKSRWSSIISGAEDGGEDTTDTRSPNTILEAAAIEDLYEPSYLAGNNIFMSAQYLNINGIIQSGIPMRTLVIPESMQAEIDAYQAKFDNKEVTDETYTGLSINNGVDDDPAMIPVIYNAETKRLELNPIITMGGYMELYGHIMNTGVGELRVMDGYATIDITNNTGTALALGTIDTGSGIEGTIKITDTAKRVSVDGQDEKAPLVTVIKRLGNTIKFFDNDNGTGEVSLADGDVISTIAGRSTQYNPLEHQYYSWTARNRATWTEEYSKTKKTRFFLWGSSSSTSTTPISSKNRTPQVQIGADVIRVVPNHNETYWYDRKYYLSHTGWSEVDYDTSGTWGVWYDETWKYNRTATETIIHNHNVAAFNPIKINFLGADTGYLSVNSKGNIVVDGQLKNTAGNTLLKSDGAILQGTSEWAGIIADQLDLQAGGGIGTANRSVRTDLIDTGSLAASTQAGDIFVEESKGTLKVGAVTASAGDVNITAESGLVGTDGSALVKGNAVNLEVRRGGIGTADSAFQVDSKAVASGGVNASAASDIYIAETTGDLYLGKVESLGGDVQMEAAGNIIDNNEVQTEDTRVKEDLLALWDEMALTGESAAEAAEQTVAAYERMKELEYKTYWQYRQRFTAEDGSPLPYNPNSAIEFSVSEADYYRTELGWTDTQITKLEDTMTAKYHELNQTYGSIGEIYDAAWSYAATTSERETLTAGSQWTEAQLENSIGIGVLKEVSDTRIWIEDPNVAGRNVELTAVGSIGRDLTAEPVTIKLDGRHWSDLTDEEKLMILSAERKDITFTGADEITIIPRDAVDVQAAGTITATAGGNIYLGSETDMNVARVEAGGDIRIKSRQNVTNSAANGVAAIVGQDLILEAGRGAIGREEKAILVDLGAGILTARAADDIYLESLDDSFNLDTIYAVRHVSLVSPDSIFNATNPDINIRAESLNLLAAGTFGNSLKFLKIGLDPTGSLTAHADGNIFINSPRHSLTISSISSGGDITLFGGNDISIGSTLGGIATTYGNVLIDSAGSILDGDDDPGNSITAQDMHFVVGDSVGSAENTLEINTLSQGVLTVEAPGGVYLEETTGDVIIDSVIAQNGGVRLIADGSILSNQSDSVTADITSGLGVELTSATGTIGTEVNRMLIDSSRVASGNVTAVSPGSIYLTELDGDLNVDHFASATGDINVVAQGSIYNSAASDIANFTGTNITLTSQTGAVGTVEARMVTTATGKTNIEAETDVYLEERGGDLVADYIIGRTGTVDLLVPDGSLDIVRIDAGILNLVLPGVGETLEVGLVNIADELRGYADNIQLSTVNHTGTGPLEMTLVGGSKSMADQINVKITSDIGIEVNRIEGDFISFDADTADLGFERAVVGTRAVINNRFHTVIADNIHKVLFDCDLQLFPEDNEFYLYIRSDRQMMTNAKVVNYDPYYIINQFSTENSFVRLTSKMPEIIKLPEWAKTYFSSFDQGEPGQTNVILTVPDNEDREEEEVGTDV